MKATKNIKSKQILLTGLVALVLVAGFYRWSIDTKNNALPVVVETDKPENVDLSLVEKNQEEKLDYFEKAKYDRDYARSEAIAVLNQISEENISDEVREKNEQSVAKNVEKSQMETTIESLIISKGFENCIVFIENDGISVVVKTENLDSKQANQIKDIILSQTNFKSHQIKISYKAE